MLTHYLGLLCCYFQIHQTRRLDSNLTNMTAVVSAAVDESFAVGNEIGAEAVEHDADVAVDDDLMKQQKPYHFHQWNVRLIRWLYLCLYHP